MSIDPKARVVAPRFPVQTEKQLQRSVLQLARITGWTLTYHTFDSRKSSSGYPDLVLVRPPRVLWVELKRDGERPRPSQQEWIDALRASGQEVYVWTPSDWDEIMRVLRR